jgi:NADPH:quinone reductase
MKKMVVNSPGGPEALTIEHFELPKLFPGWVTVKTTAIPINREDLLQRAGLLQNQVYPCTPGYEFCGEIIEVSEDISQRFVREKVYFWGNNIKLEPFEGAYSSYIQAPLDNLICLPFEVDLLKLASFGSAGIMAFDALQSYRKTEQKILVTGASGGLGSILLILGTYLGQTMFAGTTSDEKIDYCKSLGAKEAINIRDGSLSDLLSGHEFDGVIDLLGYRTFEQGLKLVKRGGLLVSAGTITGAETQINLFDLQRGVTVRGLNRNMSKDKIAEFLARIIKVSADNSFPDINMQRYDLEDAPLAHEIIEKRQSKGRSVLIP